MKIPFIARFVLSRFDQMHCPSDDFHGEVEQNENDSTSAVLERIFGMCNHGAPNESEEFKNSVFRSLSVGDFIILWPGREEQEKFIVGNCGFSKLVKI